MLGNDSPLRGDARKTQPKLVLCPGPGSPQQIRRSLGISRGYWVRPNRSHLLDGVHRSTCRESLILVAKLRNLKESVHTVSFKAMDFQTSSPVLFQGVSNQFEARSIISCLPAYKRDMGRPIPRRRSGAREVNDASEPR